MKLLNKQLNKICFEKRNKHNERQILDADMKCLKELEATWFCVNISTLTQMIFVYKISLTNMYYVLRHDTEVSRHHIILYNFSFIL